MGDLGGLDRGNRCRRIQAESGRDEERVTGTEMNKTARTKRHRPGQVYPKGGDRKAETEAHTYIVYKTADILR